MKRRPGKPRPTRSNVINGIDIRDHLGIVHAIAQRYKRHLHGALEYDDIVQAGLMGLCTGCEKFEHERGLKPTTYVSWWIRQGINRELQNMGRTIRVPVHEQAKVLQAWKRGEADVAMPCPTTSLNQPSRLDREGDEWIQNVPDDAPHSAPDEQAARNQVDAHVLMLIAKMPERERWVLRMRQRGYTLVECAELMPRGSKRGLAPKKGQVAKPKVSSDPLSRERIRQLQVQGRDRLKALLPAEMHPDGPDC